MWIRAFPRRAVAALIFACVALAAERASADPVAFSGVLVGTQRFALADEELQLVFPDFTVSIQGTQLTPGFCFSCGNGAPVPLTQSTGTFSLHSVVGPGGLNPIDAEVTGSLSFVGPTGFIDIAPERGAHDDVAGAIGLSGFLRVTQGGRVLFDGSLLGTGTASVSYQNRFAAGDTRLEGYQYRFSGVAATPEPASMLLVGSGIALLLRRRVSGRPMARQR